MGFSCNKFLLLLTFKYPSFKLHLLHFKAKSLQFYRWHSQKWTQNVKKFSRANINILLFFISFCNLCILATNCYFHVTLHTTSKINFIFIKKQEIYEAWKFCGVTGDVRNKWNRNYKKFQYQTLTFRNFLDIFCNFYINCISTKVLKTNRLSQKICLTCKFKRGLFVWDIDYNKGVLYSLKKIENINPCKTWFNSWYSI